jgi:ribonuclease G
VFLFLKKIEDKKKKTFETIVQSIKPKGFGVIVRTVAEGKKTTELEKICRTCQQGCNVKKLPTAHHPSKF